VLSPDYDGKPTNEFDMSFELAEYSLGIGRFQRKPAEEHQSDEYSYSDEPDVRPPDRPLKPITPG
jgi:hypothetical protein